MFQEMRLVLRIHRVPGFEHTPPTAHQVFAMATANGGHACGFGGSIGTLEAGKKADIVLVDLKRIEEPYLDPDVSIVDAIVHRARGNDVDIDYLLEIVPGTTNKSRVSALLGAPSTKSDYGEETWIYISAKTKTVAFFKEELITRKVIYIAFDANGIVGSIGRLSEKDGTKIEYVSRETPTAGQRITLIQQLIGNIGRFNSTGAGEQ